MIGRRVPSIASDFRVSCLEASFLKPVVFAAWLVFALIVSLSSARAQNPVPQFNQQSVSPGGQQQRLVTNYGKLPLSFEVNQGQTDGRVKFLSRGSGYNLSLTGDAAVLELRGSGARSKKSGGEIGNWKLGTGKAIKTRSNSPYATDLLQMRLVGANPKATVTGLDELPGKSNYFIGNDPKKWRTNVSNYAKVKYENVYPGVDLIYYGNQRQLEYDFVVAPGEDPSVIKLDVGAGLAPPSVAAGLSRHQPNKNGGVKPPLRIDANGDLIVKTNGGEVRFQKPVVYQIEESRHASVVSSQLNETVGNGQRTPGNRRSTIDNRKFLDGHYVLRARHQVGFEVASYDHTIPLIIDPVLQYSTIFGGSSASSGQGVAVDSSGNIYVTGVTKSTDFPTVNAVQPTGGGTVGSSVFVCKLNPTATAFVYST